jgi:hypothetical protein
MPPQRWSRQLYTAGLSRDGVAFLSDRERFPFKSYRDNRVHVVRQGDTLWGLAAHYFRDLPRPAGFWWVIADFQPNPIRDPTLELQPGAVLIVPSSRTVQEAIFSVRRQREATP